MGIATFRRLEAQKGRETKSLPAVQTSSLLCVKCGRECKSEFGRQVHERACKG